MHSEMLGNKYFLARNYRGAAQNLQYVLSQNPINKAARKKIIICYTQTGEIEKAFENFYSLVEEDISFIINTDPVADDCPCPELVFDMEQKLENNQESIDFNLILGMLWLYCNEEKSIYYFNRVLQIDPGYSKVKIILALLKSRAVDKEKI